MKKRNYHYLEKEKFLFQERLTMSEHRVRSNSFREVNASGTECSHTYIRIMKTKWDKCRLGKGEEEMRSLK